MHNQQIIKIKNLDEKTLQDRDLDSVRIVINFTRENLIPNQKVVLLLLDLHQHPLTVVHFIQFLTRLNYKVVCPYLADVFLKSAMINPEQSYSFIISLITDIHKLLIQGEFQIVAHGMSAPIGLRLRQQFGLLCQKVVLCNPLLNFEKPSRTDSFVESDTKLQTQVRSQSESTLSMDDLEYSIEKTQRSNFQAMSPSEQSTIEPVNTQQQYEIVQSRPSKLQRSAKTQVQTLETPSNSIKQAVDNTQFLKDGQTNELNQELQVFYKDVQLLSGLMKAHDVSRLSDLELVTEINRFFKINSLLTPVSFMFRFFLRLLYSVFVFSPLEQIEQYHIYKSVFDRHFFESFAEMKIMLETNKTQWTDDMNLYCLVSSHGCFNSEEHLKKMNESRASFKKTQCRTIVGAGHDLFSVAGNVIEKLLR
ncbi:Alpha/Beta_hydrolase fold [Hexamita inflata]|uniref:Alpha/Beta hydrolase fold n=1 Tax=Hexamita inflata TaxID=28002 RepID=A0AA86QDP0_9EUKA|nr:Alpha/Beta hydrolase fold [Hexamita inflata]